MPEDTQINVIVQNEPDQIVNVQVSGSEDTIVYVNPEIYANGVSSVNGRIGMVSLSKDDVGLHEVENISIVATSGELNDKINNLNTGFASIVSGIYNSQDRGSV